MHKVLHRIQKFTDSVRTGEIKGYSGKNLQNVVLIGIGGSYLSVEFVYEALVQIILDKSEHMLQGSKTPLEGK